jgi:CRP-like cAMP-binding protein
VKLDPAAFVADPELVTALEQRSTPVPCTKDCELFHQGDAPKGLFILKSGETTISLDFPAGKQAMAIKAASGSLLGLPGLIGNEPYTLTAVAHAGAEVGFVSRDEFNSLMRSDTLLSMKVLQVLAAEVRSARKAIVER